ncbi:phage protein Gp27 family protein [Marinobacterium stanieri]|uniref:DUF3486 family protein n=1 Tax=Marinobacterium stanieri TaxID=49186 RepID=A0A1N6RP77_9GAMM|nr:phage protein Gp27 family protein [Marinobacterium stanieri]SIQ30674.1 Protein of unknown function [Marinobacterium stanieri]
MSEQDDSLPLIARPGRSSVARLPDDVKRHLEKRLVEDRMTLDELIADLKNRFPEHAEELPSRSAVHRYGQKLDKRLAAIRASTEAAKIIRAHAGDREDARSEALTAMIQSELFESIMSLQEADDEDVDIAQRIGLLSDAAKNIATLTRSSVTLKKYQEDIAEAARQELLREQKEKLAAMPSKGGVTEDTKQAIREALGIS